MAHSEYVQTHLPDVIGTAGARTTNSLELGTDSTEESKSNENDRGERDEEKEEEENSRTKGERLPERERERITRLHGTHPPWTISNSVRLPLVLFHPSLPVALFCHCSRKHGGRAENVSRIPRGSLREGLKKSLGEAVHVSIRRI